MLYLIQGIFFQPQTGLSVASGQAVIATTGTLPFLFSGFWEEGDQVGHMFDQFGASRLTHISLHNGESTQKLSFVKIYDHRRDPIHYQLARQEGEGFWRGEYDGDLTGSGKTHCLVILVPNDFLEI